MALPVLLICGLYLQQARYSTSSGSIPPALTTSSSRTTVIVSSGLTTTIMRSISARTPCVDARSDRPTFFISQVEYKRARSCHMAEEIDLRFLGEQIKRLQGDVRQVKSDMAQADAKLEAFRETVDDRFEHQIELIKSSFGSLSQELASFRGSVGGRFETIDGRFESIDGRFESID